MKWISFNEALVCPATGFRIYKSKTSDCDYPEPYEILIQYFPNSELDELIECYKTEKERDDRFKQIKRELMEDNKNSLDCAYI